MISLTLQQLAEITQGQIITIGDSGVENETLMLRSVSTDSRDIAEDCLFIALKGERFDAHQFADNVVAAGAKALLVARQLTVNCPQVVVPDTLIALGQLAAWVRQQSHARVVGLTGSAGKTSVKEMTAAILAQRGKTLYTAGNLNNDIGVPLTLLRLTTEDQYAVIEMGANHQGEIAYTTNLVKPESALVNNLLSAHLEGFGSPEGVAKAKGEIFQALADDGTAIINLDSHDQPNWQTQFNPRQTVWRYGLTPQNQADFYPLNIKAKQLTTNFTLHSPAGEIDIVLPLPGVHNIANALAASALALSVGATLVDIQQGLAITKAVPGRLYPIRLSDNKIIFDDSYNANSGSMIAAIRVLSDMPGYRIFVAGDIGELGPYATECHQQVGDAARQYGVDNVLSVGDLSREISQRSGCGQHFVSKSALLAQLIPLVQQNDVVSILIKGSRSAAMEEIVDALKEYFSC